MTCTPHSQHKAETTEMIFNTYFTPPPTTTIIKKVNIIAGSLESANSSILAVRRHFKEVVGKKNQDFIIMSLVNPSNLIGCGGDI